MRNSILNAALAMILFLFIMALVEIYAFKGIYTSTVQWNSIYRSIIHWGYWVLNILAFGLLILAMTNFRAWRGEHPNLLMFVMAIFFVLWVPKFVLALFHLIDDARWLFTWVGKSLSPKVEETEVIGNPISRTTFITSTGQILAGLALVSFLYGVTRGKFAFRVLEHQVAFKNLPSALQGLRVVQISDAHLGSFMDNFDPVKEAIQMVNDLKPDLIMFTGDLVNVEASEAEPWIPIFKELKAKHGKYSILGNHDYADYGDMTEEERETSRNRVKEIHGEMGFDLLLNDNRQLTINGERLDVIGVENWGKGFVQHGDLTKAMDGIDETLPNILLSHDPTHYEEQVLGKKNIDLTLSGHTHGMQIGIEIPWLGIKLSPARLRYKRWGGLYTDNQQHIHVNRGFGVLAFPGRVGMPPEITLLELTKA
ncbi:MAG: putative MPP superfamily phosphohydrolase [Flavobacteriales bacterium]|jgi:predicted MPP superfamily phosphohydrolase